MIDTSFIKGNPDSDALCREIAKASGGVCLLSFSRGKDALAAWLNLSRFFRRIIPFTCAGIPHVGFADEYLAYCERIFGTHIIRNHLGLPRAWTAYGLNASDSLDRMITVRQCKGRYYGTRSFYPNFDWTHKQIMEVLQRSNIRLSNEYHIAARSFAGGLMPHNLLAVEKRAPQLFRQLEYYYPLLKASLCRSHWRNERCLPQKTKQDAPARPKTDVRSKTRDSGGRSARAGRKKSSARRTTRR